MNNFERLWDSIEDDLGFNNCNMHRDRPYDGQPHTDTGIRGKQELIGVTMRDIRDCFIRACFLASGDQCNGAFYQEATKGEHAVLSENDLYKLDFDKMDPVAICQNLTCEIERIMNIFPNVPSLKCTSDPE